MIESESAISVDGHLRTPALPDSLARFARFSDFFDLHTGAIGRVVASEKEPAGSHTFFMWADEGNWTLDVGHIVVATSEEAVVIGVVDEPRRFSDLRSFLDDFFDRSLERGLTSEPPTKRPEILVFAVNVLATRHLRDDVDSHRPPLSGPVYFATKKAIDFALGHENFTGTAIPALLHTNGNAERDDDGNEVRKNGDIVFQRAPIWLDEDYLLGPEAGHANWTGQSGLATKTSHALFLTSAIFQGMRNEGKSVAALMFNVKGPDLLWVDKPANPAPGLEAAYAAADCAPLSDFDLAAYDALGVNPEPFELLKIFAPFKPTMQPMEDTVNLSGMHYHGRLNTLRNAAAETQRVHPILWELQPFLFSPHKVFERDDLDDKLLGFITEIRDQRGITTLRQMEKLFAEIDQHFKTPDENGKTPDSWNGHHQFTIRKAGNRLRNLASKFGGLLAEGSVNFGRIPQFDAPFEDQEVRVIDIAGCNTNVQEMLVTRLIDSVWKKAEREELGVSKVLIFVDELNKYAPGGGQGALRDTLVDIAARGRHLNVVLFGAQQFRSKVDDEILGNCGTSFYGRVGDEEIINASYRSLSETAKAELLGLRKGRLLVRHAHFRTPLFGSFPKPPAIKGMGGQQVFNNAGESGPADTVPADGLYFLLKRLMGNATPGLAEVRTASDGIPSEYIVEICRKVEEETERAKGTSAERITAWTRAQGMLKQLARQRH